MEVQREKVLYPSSISVIIPCHNEAENVAECIRRVPRMGSGTEVIVIDDGSTDGTAEAARGVAVEGLRVQVISYSPNMGKGHAVRTGFDAAAGDILMVLDADMAVPPEELPGFYGPIATGRADAANGTRFVLPMEPAAMNRVHRFGNRVFAFIFSRLLRTRLTDTLCGTKAIRRVDYKKMKMGRCPWGDFDILIGIGELGLKLVEVPVSYRARRAGRSKMKTLRHGFQLLRMCWYAYERLRLGRIHG